MTDSEKPDLLEGWDFASLFLPMLEADNPKLDRDEITANLNENVEPLVESISARIANRADEASLEERISALEHKILILRYALEIMGSVLAARMTARRPSVERGVRPRATSSVDEAEMATKHRRTARLRMLNQ